MAGVRCRRSDMWAMLQDNRDTYKCVVATSTRRYNM